MITTLSFFLKISINAISFNWRNDTQTFVTCHPKISLSLRLLVLCHVRHILPFVYIFKELFSFIGSLGKCHTSIFNTVIFPGTRKAMLPTVGEGIAYDWINKRLYWSDSSTNKIYSIGTDGTNRIMVAAVHSPRAVTVNPCRG